MIWPGRPDKRDAIRRYAAWIAERDRCQDHDIVHCTVCGVPERYYRDDYYLTFKEGRDDG